MKFKAATLDRMPILAVAVFLTATTATPVFGQTSQDEEASGGIGEIVVTAQRREANLRDVPVAITSTDGKTIAERGLKNVSELTSQLPGVEFSALNTSVSINIRGIGNSNSNQGADPGVAYHLDGVYLAQTALAGSSFLDEERVEVLRGPQGTLFGRNATGGSVNVISRRPTPHFEAEAGVVADVDPSQIHLDGFVSGPLSASGKILARFSARTDFNAGYTKYGLAAGPDHLDVEKRYALRGQLQFEMTANLTANLAVDYAKANDDGQAVFLLGAPAVVNGMTTTLSPADVAAITATKMGLASTAFGSVDDRRTFADQGARDGSFLGVRAGLEWQGEAGTLKILGAYGRTRLATLLDGDGTSANFTSTLFTQRAHQYFGEAVYSSNGDGPIQFILGANAFRQSSDEYVELPINNIGAAVKIPSHLITTSYAAFGRLDVRVHDGLKLFAGGRFTHDAKSLTETNNFSGTKSDSDSWEQFTYEFGASYEVSRMVNAYAKYATGFKGGGFSAGSLAPPFDPETNQSIEVGLKGLYFGRLSNGAVRADRRSIGPCKSGSLIKADERHSLIK